VSIFFAALAPGFGFTVVLASFFAPIPEPTLPVVVDLGPAEGLEGIASLTLPKPFGNGFFDFACAWAFNQPAKSGSPPSSNVTGLEGLRGVLLVEFSVGASKKESSSILPHASSTSSSSNDGPPKYWSLDVRSKLGVEGLSRVDFSFVALPAAVDARALCGGIDVDRGSAGLVGAPFVPDCMSPLAAVILFVKEEMAHPAHEVSF
jgi:hypothetical protein